MATRRKVGRGVDAKGRSRSDAKHVRLYWWLLGSPAYRHLTCYGRSLLVEFVYRHNGENNGRISMSVREASTLLNVAPGTAIKALGDLQVKGFIKPALRGSFDLKKRHATEWTLTMEPLGEAEPTKDFMQWKPPKI